MSKTPKPPAPPPGNPVVRRTLAVATLGLASCSGGAGTRSQPPQVVPPAPPPMAYERHADEEAALQPSDAGPLVAPDAAPTEQRELDPNTVDSKQRESYPPQVAPDPIRADDQSYANPPPMVPTNRNPPPMRPPGPKTLPLKKP